MIPSTDTILASLSECSEFALAVVVINDAVDIGQSTEELLISLKEVKVEDADLELDIIVERIDNVVMLRFILFQNLDWGLILFNKCLLF